MPRYLVRIHEDRLPPVLPYPDESSAHPEFMELVQKLVPRSKVLIWAKHPTKRPHYHMLVLTDEIKPNNMRQIVRKCTVGKSAYSVKEADADQPDDELIVRSGSYYCFKVKHKVYVYGFHNVADEQIREMKDRAKELAEHQNPASKAKTDIVQAVLDEVRYSLDYTELENALRFRQALTLTRNPNVYAKMQHYYRVWRDLSLKGYLEDTPLPPDMEEDILYETDSTKVQIAKRARAKLNDIYMNDVTKHILYGL